MRDILPIMVVLAELQGCTTTTSDDKEVKLFLETATEKARDTGKSLIIEFWAPECGPCIRLKKTIKKPLQWLKDQLN